MPYGFACVRGVGGSYCVEFDDLREVYDEEGAATFEGAFHLAYVRRDGSSATSEPISFEGARSLVIEPLGVQDFDGDGASELVFDFHYEVHEGGVGMTDVLTPTGTRLLQYPAAQRFSRAVDSVRDADGDGRLDVVAFAPWARGGFAYSESGGGWVGPRSLFHALADGTFSDTDATARAFWNEECPALPTLIPALTDPDDDGTYEKQDLAIRNVTCAALVGDTNDVLRRFEAEWAASPCTYDASSCAHLDVLVRRRISDVAASRGDAASQ